MNAAIDTVSSMPIRRSSPVARRIAACVAACSISAAAAAVASASVSATPDVRQVVIRVVSLDPTTRVEAERLYQRIRRAARTVCDGGATKVLREWQAQRACMADAIARAVEDVDSSMLTAVHLRATDQDERARTFVAARDAASSTRVD